MQHRPPRISTYPPRVSHVTPASRQTNSHADPLGNQQRLCSITQYRPHAVRHLHSPTARFSDPVYLVATYKAAPHRCYPQATVPFLSSLASAADARSRKSESGMVSRDYSHDYSHLVLDPAALGVSSWADPAAVEIPPQLLAALGEYLSAGRGDGDAAAADETEADDEFMMYEFKVRRCARARSHDWTACPYAHPGEAARRRDPRRVSYTGEPCPDFRRRPGAACPRANACPFAHGTFELWLHPSRYRTRPCRAGVSCRRRVCFFAHTATELRAAAAKEETPLSLSLSPKSTLASLWESPPVSPVQGRRRWIDAVDEPDADVEMEDLMFAMRELSLRKQAVASSAPVLPLVTEDDGPDFGWVSELVM